MSCPNTSMFSYTTGELIWDKSKSIDYNAGKNVINALPEKTIIALTRTPKTGALAEDELYIKNSFDKVTQQSEQKKGRFFGTTTVSKEVTTSEYRLYKLTNLCLDSSGNPASKYERVFIPIDIPGKDRFTYLKDSIGFDNELIFANNNIYKVIVGPKTSGASWWGGKKNKRRRTSKKTTKKSKTRRNKKV